MQPSELSNGQSSNLPLVSIAMASFNGGAFIAEQLDSILSQTFAQFELVITDDCSTDETTAILNHYASQDNRIRVFFNKENMGYRETFYTTLQHCRGEYLLFCDQDDIWATNKIETLLNQAGHNLLVFSDSELINEKGNSMNVKLSDTVKMVQPGAIAINRGFVIGNCVWGHTILFNRNLLVHIQAEKKDHPHDWWFAVVSSHLHKIKYCPQVLNFYRQHRSNVTQAIPVKAGKVAGRKMGEFETLVTRLESIAALPFNEDQAFYRQWLNLAWERKNSFSFALFSFLLKYRTDIFSLKRKSFLSQVIEIRKMCRKVK